MKKVIIGILVLVILAIGAFVGIKMFTGGQEKVEAEQPPISSGSSGDTSIQGSQGDSSIDTSSSDNGDDEDNNTDSSSSSEDDNTDSSSSSGENDEDTSSEENDKDTSSEENDEDTSGELDIDIPGIDDNTDTSGTGDTSSTDNTDDSDTTNINAPSRFADVPKAMWCYKAITKMSQGGLVNGYGNGNFGPGDTITVGQFAQILARAKGYETGAGATGWWAELATVSCVQRKLIKDRGPVTQDVYDIPITREEAVAALQLATDKDKINNNQFDSKDIPDFDDISDEYKREIIKAYNSGITSGIDSSRTFLPKRTLTRAEVCQLFYNLGWVEAGVGADPVSEK